MFDFAPSGLQWVHDPFVLVTDPIPHTLCGGFTYEATFIASSIDTVSAPMKYDTATRMYSFYSEDFSLIGD